MDKLSKKWTDAHKELCVRYCEGSGFYLAKAVLLPSGEGISFWQQVSKYYRTSGGIKHFLLSKYGSSYASFVNMVIVERFERKWEIDRLLCKIAEFCDKLDQADNNLRYITAVKALYRYTTKLYKYYDDLSEYFQKKYFGGEHFSFYERLSNSIIDYNNGYKPF